MECLCGTKKGNEMNIKIIDKSGNQIKHIDNVSFIPRIGEVILE